MTERTIHILPEQVASQIAAGEVVERPASALKELVENSIDAGARSIDIIIERGGGGLIAVSDDGCGMGREDTILALRRHATSKIRDASDLGAIRTLGFRGEALAAIASVSKLRMQTRRADAAEGVEIIAEGGEITATRACAMACGTQIEVRDLFFNTPARLKFLKTQTTEQTAAVEAIQRLALSSPRLAFALSAEGRTIIQAARTASTLERVRQLFGAHIANRMLPFEASGAGMRASGLAASSQESYPTARLLLTFVNARTVRDRALIRAVTQAYQTVIPRGRYPAVVLFLELSPEEVDVNVHPMKTEVRFRRSGAVFELVHHALRARVADQVQAAPAAVVIAAGTTAPAQAASPPPVADRGAATVREAPERPLRLVPNGVPVRMSQSALGLGFGRSAPEAQPQPAQPQYVSDNAGPRSAAAPRYADLRVLGQIFTGFIALEGDDGLILIDQHAAHERVTFEKLRAELRGGAIRVQAMLTPATIELNPARVAQVTAAMPELRAMGFELELFGPAAILIKGAPAVFGAEGGAQLLSDMIDAMGEQGFRGGRETLEEHLKTLACHGSVRSGRVLRAPEITELLAELDRTEFKTNCPHGRPVHIEFRRGTIERMFRR
ncbi:MAG TPA: DNA mismatch repair endonuclease MutL [Candidatus Binataceae bacterium]|nr:DNA mismatch repair endonuclease MutL [Candidatus Binataceae bacterium]